MADELPEVKRLRLKLKAARSLLRDLAVACAQAEDALDAAAHRPSHVNAQTSKEAQHDRHDRVAA